MTVLIAYAGKNGTTEKAGEIRKANYGEILKNHGTAIASFGGELNLKATKSFGEVF